MLCSGPRWVGKDPDSFRLPPPEMSFSFLSDDMRRISKVGSLVAPASRQILPCPIPRPDRRLDSIKIRPEWCHWVRFAFWTFALAFVSDSGRRSCSPSRRSGGLQGVREVSTARVWCRDLISTRKC